MQKLREIWVGYTEKSEIYGILQKLSPSITHFNGNFMSRGYKWLFVDYTILVLSPSLLLCLYLGMSLFTEQRCFFKYFSVSRPLSSGAVAVSLAVPPLPHPPVLLPPGWRHSPPSLLLLPLPHLPHSLWLLSRLWPQSPGHSLKTIYIYTIGGCVLTQLSG